MGGDAPMRHVAGSKTRKPSPRESKAESPRSYRVDPFRQLCPLIPPPSPLPPSPTAPKTPASAVARRNPHSRNGPPVSLSMHLMRLDKYPNCCTQ